MTPRESQSGPKTVTLQVGPKYCRMASRYSLSSNFRQTMTWPENYSADIEIGRKDRLSDPNLVVFSNAFSVVAMLKKN